MGKIFKNSNKSAYFNGSTSYITYASNDAFSFTDGTNDIPFELEFDLNVKAIVGTFHELIDKRSLGAYEMQMYWQSNNIYFSLGSNSISNKIGVTIRGILVGNTYHIKYTYDGSKLWTGIKVYVNGVQRATYNNSAGTYTGLVKTAAPLYIGRTYSGTYPLNGYIRNIRIKKYNQVVFNALLKDSNNITYDSVAGLVGTSNNVVVADLETSKILVKNNPWTYFNGTSSQVANIGTTSIYGFFNKGIFRIEFDMIIVGSGNAGKRILVNSFATSQYGIYIYFSAAQGIRSYFYNGTGTAGFTASSSTLPINYPIHYVWEANGITARMTILQDNIAIYNSGWLSITLNSTPPSTCTGTLSISQNVYSNIYMRNLKIYNSADKSSLVTHIPLQDPNNISYDVVGGLNGTNTDLIVVNSYTNDRWGYFNGINSCLAILGTKAQFNWMHETGKWVVEFDYSVSSVVGSYKPFFCNRVSTGGNAIGVAICIWNAYLNVQVGNGVSNILLINSSGFFTLGEICHIKIVSDGTTVFAYKNGNLITQANYTGAFGTGDSQYIPYIGRAQSQAYFLTGNLKEFKIYNDENGSNLYYYLPFQDPNKINVDLVQGLEAYNLNVSLINQCRNALKSSNLFCEFGNKTEGDLGDIYPIGDTTTFNWIHQTGIFQIDFEHYVAPTTLNTDIMFTTRVSPTNNGIYLFRSNLSSGERLYVYMGSGSSNIFVNYWNVYTNGEGLYRIKLIGNGSGLRVIYRFNGGNWTDLGYKSFAGSIVGSGNAIYAAAIGGYTTNYSNKSKMRNFYFYESSDTSKLKYYFPLIDASNFGMEVYSGTGLNGTAQGRLRLKEI